MDMVANVLSLDRSNIIALRITDTYSLHRVVFDLFEDIRSVNDKLGSVPSGILWADQGGDYRGRKILLLSNRTPRGNGIGLIQPCNPFSSDFLEHNRYNFKTIINPTRRDAKSDRLIPIKGRENIASWFADKAKRNWGFEIDDGQLQMGKVEVLSFKDKAKRQVVLTQANVSGRLLVTDREKFKKSFTQGIGRSRGFGCGLLQIAPIRE